MIKRRKVGNLFMTKPKAAFVCVHNKSLMLHTTMNYVALWNVVQKIYTLLLMPIVGITQGGVQTIIAYFDGHQKENKKQETLSITVCYTVIYGFFILVLIFCCGTNICFLFLREYFKIIFK